MSDAYFQQVGEDLVPAARAKSPWAEDMMHGRLLGGLAARAIEREYLRPDWKAARLTVDLFRPAAMAAVQVRLSPVRRGRKVQVIDAALHCGGHDVGRATAVLLATAQEPPGEIWRPSYADWPDPETMPMPPDGWGQSEEDGWLFRTVRGGFNTGGQSRVWTNDTLHLVDGEELSPFVRAAVSGDIACPLANSSDQGLHYINADYTMMLGRYPVGDWIGLEVAQQIQSDGISIAASTMFDRLGPFGSSGGSSLVRPPLPIDD